ncbi:sigma-54-dependent Fis family transcriptional regulator, partial [bacterium]
MKKEPRGTILVVDDSPQTLEVIQRNLEAENYSVFIATSVSDGLNILDSEDIDLVITDLKMPKVGGIELIKHIRDNYRDMEVIMITGYPSVESAIQAVKLGADDYISKPFTDKELLSAVEKSLEKLYARRKTQKSSYLKEKYGIIGESEVMQSVYKIIEKASITNATILITGESGTGKELVARAIHYKSDRASAPFVAFNCGGIPEELLESALFG